jgi:hypothetical protein
MQDLHTNEICQNHDMSRCSWWHAHIRYSVRTASSDSLPVVSSSATASSSKMLQRKDEQSHSTLGGRFPCHVSPCSGRCFAGVKTISVPLLVS